MMRRAISVLLLLLAPSALPASAASVSTTWLGGTGNWSAAGSWSNGVPDNGADSFTALVDGGNPIASQVTVGSNVGVDALQIDLGDQVTVTPSGSLSVAGPTISNAGQITLQGDSLNPIGGALEVGPSGATLLGGGSVLLQNGSIDPNQVGPFTNQDNAISGYGLINANGFVNQGVVEANVPGKVLQLPFQRSTLNQGTLRAVNGGVLAVSLYSVINNTDGAVMQFSNGGVLSAGDEVEIFGGEIDVSDHTSLATGAIFHGSRINVDSTSRLSTLGLENAEVDAEGPVTVAGPILGSLVSRGSLSWTFDANPDPAPVTITNFGDVTFRDQVDIGSGGLSLQGSGAVTLASSGSPSSARVFGPLRNLDNRIEGNGTIYQLVQNSGTVTATSGTLSIFSPGLTHTGVFAASPGATLEMAATTVDGSGSWLADGGRIHVTGDVETSGDVSVLRGGWLGVDTTMAVENLLVDDTGALDVKGLLKVAGNVSFAGANGGRWDFEPGSVFEASGSGPWHFLEAEGRDEGQVAAGFTLDNFFLPELMVGPDGRLALRDRIDNGNRASGTPEAVYVDTLAFSDALGLLDLNGIHLYYNHLVGSASQIIDVVVPEPGAAGLLALALLGLGLARRS